MENRNTGNSPGTPSSSMPHDRHKEEEMGKKPGQQSQGGSSQEWQRDNTADRGRSGGPSSSEQDRKKEGGQSMKEGGQSHSGQSGKAGQSNQSGNQSR